jgi:Sec-independent protein translocase protein TatA
MDSFFGIGAPELIFILILAGIVLGPHRIRDIARWLGKTTAQLQAISRGFTAQLTKELDAIDESGDLKETLQEVKDLRRQVTELRHEITRGVSEPVNEARTLLKESKESLNQTILPPALQAAQDEKVAPAANGERPRPPLKLPKPVKVADDPE